MAVITHRNITMVSGPYEVLEIDSKTTSELLDLAKYWRWNSSVFERNITSRIPDNYNVISFVFQGGPSADGTDPKILVKVVKKSEDELYKEALEYFIENLGVTTHKNPEDEKLKLVSEGRCLSCKMKVKGWEPMFGALAPEWWASMRERGIDPATGHKLNCGEK
jgi:hypothetical protein